MVITIGLSIPMETFLVQTVPPDVELKFVRKKKGGGGGGIGKKGRGQQMAS